MARRDVAWETGSWADKPRGRLEERAVVEPDDRPAGRPSKVSRAEAGSSPARSVAVDADVRIDAGLGAAMLGSEPWQLASRAVLAALVILVLLTFRDYGISHDEEVQHTYGKMLWDFYLSGFQDLRALEYKDLFRYGGLFDMVAAVLVKIVPLPEYDTRHLLSGLCGVIGIAGAGRIAETVSGRRAGFLAIALLALTSSYYGSMFNNTKDIPFAAGMAWTLCFGMRLMPQMPRLRLGSVLAFGAAFGLTFGIRVGVLMMAFYLFVGMLAWAWKEAKSRPAAAVGRDFAGAVAHLLPGAAVAYALMAFFWPWGAAAPFNPLRALFFFSHHPIVIDSMLFGTKIVSTHIPWDYIPGYLLVKLPESTLLLLIVGLGVLASRWRRSEPAWRQQSAMLLLAALMPIAMFILFRPTVFNGLRHFFFVVPPLTVIAAIGADAALTAAARRSRAAALALAVPLLAAALWQATTMVALHPNQSLYYNAVAGGLAGANGRFEMDYWSNSVREAALKLVDKVKAENGSRAPEKPYTVALCTEHPVFYEHVPAGWFVATEEWSKSDFFVAPTQMGCDRILDGEVIVRVERLGVVLSVVKDRRGLSR